MDKFDSLYIKLISEQTGHAIKAVVYDGSRSNEMTFSASSREAAINMIVELLKRDYAEDEFVGLVVNGDESAMEDLSSCSRKTANEKIRVALSRADELTTVTVHMAHEDETRFAISVNLVANK